MAKSKITNNARKSHEKKKPFECDICNAGFTENTLFIFLKKCSCQRKARVRGKSFTVILNETLCEGI